MKHKRIFTTLEKYKKVYGDYPTQSIEGQRHYKEFCRLLEEYSLEDIVKCTERSLTSINQQSHISIHYYDANAVTDDLLVSHIKLIHEQWNIPVPDLEWWEKAIKKQAKEMIKDYSKSELHCYMHKLENDQWYREHITDAFTFKMIRRYIDGLQKETTQKS